MFPPMFPTGLRTWVLISALLLLAAACGGQPDAVDPPPASALNQFQQGNTAFEEEDYASAVHHFRRAREMDPRQSEFHYNLGVALYRVGDFDAAAEAFDSALLRDPNRSEAHYNLALTHYARYDLSAANAHYNAYVRLAGGAPSEAVPVGRVGAQPPAQIGRTQGVEPNPFAGNPEWWKEELPRQ